MGESLSGWLGQLVMLYFGTERRMWRWMGLQNGPADSDRPDHAHLEALARRTGIDVARLSAMVLPWVEEAPRLADRFRVTVAPWRIGPFRLFDGTRRFCPLCLATATATPLWPLHWRMGGPVCVAHHVWLERACSQCQEPLPVSGLPPTCCADCATPYRATPIDPVDPRAMACLASIHRRIVKIVSDPDRARYRAMTGALDWAALGQLAGQHGHHLAADVSSQDWRAALETCAIAASEQNAVLADMPILAAREVVPTKGKVRVAPARKVMVPLKRPKPVSVLDGLKDRVAEALAQARTDLTAQGQPVTAKALRRRADQILRKQSVGQGRGLRVTEQSRRESSG